MTYTAKTKMCKPVMIERIFIITLTGIMLLTMGPGKILWTNLPLEWPTAVFQFCFLITLGCLFFSYRNLKVYFRLVIYLCTLYIGIVVVVGGMHIDEIFSINPYTIINTAGDIVNDIKTQTLSLAFRYLLFPILLTLQIFFVQRVKRLEVAKIIAGIFIINLGVTYYQGMVDLQFLNNWAIEKNQASGLCTDPNSLSMCSFLLIILLLSASCISDKMSVKTIFALVIVMLVLGMVFAGGRSMLGGLFLFSILWPIVIALAHGNWKTKNRVLVGLLSVVLFISAIFSLPLLARTLANSGTAGERLASTYYKYEQNGISGILFKDELRGELFKIGISLIKRSPTAGWGPAGFYREYPNQVYIESGIVKPSSDMVLNHYLMIAVDFGIPLLLLNMLLLLIPVVGACYCLKYEKNIQQRMAISVLILGNCVFMIMINMIPPSYYPEVLWLWTGQLALLLTDASKSVHIDKLSFSRYYKTPAIVAACIGCFLVVIGAYETSYGKAGYKARKDLSWWPLPPFDYNDRCYFPDKLDNGTDVRWCRARSSLQIPINHYMDKEVSIIFDNQFPDLRDNPVVLQYGGKEGIYSNITLREKGWRSIKIPLNDKYIYTYRAKNGEEKKFLVLSLNPSRTWTPRDYGIADDRELGVLVAIPQL